MAVINKVLPEMQRQIGHLDNYEDEYSDHEGNLLDLIKSDEQLKHFGKKVLDQDDWEDFQ